MLLQRAHRQQQTALRRCQEKVAKMKGLEEAVRQQEKVSVGHEAGVRRRDWGARCSVEQMGPCGPPQCCGGWGDVMVTTALH